MAYVAPTTRSVGDAVTAADYNIMANDVIAIFDSIKRIGRVTQATTTTVNQTVLASATNLFASSISWTADGTSAYRVQFFCGCVQTANGGQVDIYLVNNAGTSIQRLCISKGTGTEPRRPVFVEVPYTPTAGTATINIRAIYQTAGDGSLLSTSSDLPLITLSLYGPDLT